MRKGFILFFLAITSIVSATNYYVSPSGSDSNTGSVTSPFRTINKGASKLIAGDILYVRNGTYVEQVLIHLADGTEANPITIMEYPGESPVIDGTGISLRSGDALIMIYSNYVNFRGFEIRNVTGSALTSSGIHTKISHCVIHDVTGAAIGVGGDKAGDGDYSIIEYITAYNCAMSNAGGTMPVSWPAGISARRFPDYCIIRHCTVHDTWGEGISAFEATHITIEDNTVYDIYSVGIYVSDATDCLVQRNLVYMTKPMGNGPQVGFGHWNEIASPPFVNARNTFLNNMAYGCGRNFYSTAMLDCLVANNTFVNSISQSCVQLGGDHSGSRFVNNIIIQENSIPATNSIVPDGGLVLTYNAWSKAPDSDASGTGDITGGIAIAKTGSTGAGDLTGDYFKLLNTSTAINKGTQISQVTCDFFGNPRGASPDIGAHETGSSLLITGITVKGAGSSNTITTDKGTLQLTAEVSPSAAPNKAATWSIINGTGQASINSTGLVTAISNGTVTARATATDGSGVSGTLTITISNQFIPASPVFASSAIENATPSLLTMTYSLTLANIVPAASAFSVRVNSSARTVNSVAVSGTNVQLTLASPVVSGDVVTVAYNKPSGNPLQTASGGQAATITAQTVTNKVNAVIPVYVSSAIENATPSLLTMTYSLTLANIVPAASAFSVRVNSTARTVNSVAVSGTSVKLTLASPVVSGDVVTVAYTKPSGNPLQTASGGQAATLSARTVVNNILNVPPTAAITSPVSNSEFTARANITITANASDADGTVTSVEFYNGSTKLGSISAKPYTFKWNNVATGTYSLKVIVTDNKNAKTSSAAVSISVVNAAPVANKPPAVSISNPLKGNKYEDPAIIDIEVFASDPDGTIKKVDLYNGSEKLAELTTSPYSFTWKDVKAGTYSIKAIATDNSDASATSSLIEFTVSEVPIYDVNSEIINLYPNPNDGHFSIEFLSPLPAEKCDVVISDLNGKQVYHGTVSDEETLREFDLSSFKSGVYIMLIVTKEILVTKKIIKR